MFFLLIGAPASGKTTWAKELAEEAELHNKEVYVVSSDVIREELWGDERIQREPAKVFDMAHKRIINALRAGYEHVVFDATNMKRKYRVVLMDKLKELDVEKRCVIFAEPYEVLCNRNKMRSRSVPEEVIWRMLLQFEMPLFSEGYNDIQIINHNQLNMNEYIEYMRDFNQDNHNHTLDLLTHCHTAAKYVFDCQSSKEKMCLTSIAALLHDIGKPLTKVYTNFKGMPTEEAHYYGHPNVGAYLALMFESIWTPSERVLIAQLICYHMQPYFNKTEAARRRWKEIWGEDLNNFIRLLHEADEFAH